MKRLITACALIAAGCGRFGFDELDAMRDAASPRGALSLTAATFSTSSAAFVDIPGASLTIPASPGTRWLLLTNAQLESTVTSGVTVEARYLVDGVEQGMGGTEVSAPDRPGPWQHVYVLDGDDREHVITYQLRDATAASATIEALSVVAVPLPADAITYAAVDAIQPVTSTTSAPHTSLSLGALAGDYVFLFLINGTDLPGEGDLYTEWYGPSGELWMSESHLPREPWQSLFTMQRATVDLPDARVTLHAWRGSAPSQVRYVRAVALRTSAFASLEIARDDRQLLTTSAAAAPVVELTTSPPAVAASQYVFVGSIRLEESCTTAPDAERAVHVVIDNVTRTQVHSTDNCSTSPTYGGVQVLPAQPAYIAMGYSTLNGQPVVYDGAQVLLLGLP